MKTARSIPYKKIFDNQFLILPKSISAGKTFRETIKDLFKEYIVALMSIREKELKVQGLRSTVMKSFLVEKQDALCNGLLQTIDLYFAGQPATAYTHFDQILSDRLNHYGEMLNVKSFKEGTNFYRIRMSEENFPLATNEMFHIPFEKRGKVSSQRYSIPGFPSLYLGKTIYVAWEELHRPNINSFQIIRLESQTEIKYLDLTANDWDAPKGQKNSYKYLITWPLIAACSIKVKDYSDTFKPQYIIPQLLLQWVRNHKEVDGVIYNSSHIETGKILSVGDLYNFVLPVKDNKDNGLCDELCKMFKGTEAVSNQLLQFSNGGKFIMFTNDEYEKINNKIPEIEIIKGRKSAYSSSILGRLEMVLDSLPTKNIVR